VELCEDGSSENFCKFDILHDNYSICLISNNIIPIHFLFLF